MRLRLPSLVPTDLTLPEVRAWIAVLAAAGIDSTNAHTLDHREYLRAARRARVFDLPFPSPHRRRQIHRYLEAHA